MASNDPTTLTALSVITGAMRKTGQYAPGEAIAASDLNDALDVLNGLLDSLSNDSALTYDLFENVITLTPGQQSYTLGNPYAGTFSGTVTNASNVITAVTFPVVGTNGVSQYPVVVGATITGAGIPTGTTITVVGGSTVTMSANAVGSFVGNNISFTSPGQIPQERPLQIVSAYSRLTTSSSTVDFPCDVKDITAYSSIGLKSQPGPWPKWVFCNPTMDKSTLYFWPVPSQGVEFHFWTNDRLNVTSLTQIMNLPPGYYNYLQFALAELLCVDYGIPVSADVARMTRRYEAKIKSTNSIVDREISIDAAVATRNANNAGWILTGGF